MENTQKHALITGATSGIGYELTKLFAKDGYNLILVARNEENLKETAREMAAENPEIRTYIFPTDLFVPGAAEKIYTFTRDKNITVDVLVNDAGQGEGGLFVETALAREIDIIQLNIVALVSLTKYYMKEMVARNNGKILQLASSVSKAPSPMLSVYAATKAFVLSFTEALQKELEGTAVTMTALQPHKTDTDFFHKAKSEHTKNYREGMIYTPQEVAKAGYEGLMNGDATVLPGAINKMQNAMNVFVPDSAIASQMDHLGQPSDEKNGRTATKHPASARERKSINKVNGDF